MGRPNHNADNLFSASMWQARMKPTFKQAAAGAMAGTIAAFAMRQFVSLWHSTKGQRSEDGAFGLDREADVNAAQKLWQFLFQRSLTETGAVKVALALHYGHGAATGAGYALLVNKNQGFRAGFGAAYGTALWLAGDEIAVTLMRLSDPRSKTKASHVIALAAHLVYGSVTELSRRSLLKAL